MAKEDATTYTSQRDSVNWDLKKVEADLEVVEVQLPPRIRLVRS